MKRLVSVLLTSAALVSLSASQSLAESTGWQSSEDFKGSTYALTEQGLVPVDFAVRVQNGQPQFTAKWAAYTGEGFDPGFALYALESRESAETMIDVHTDTGGNIEIDELCLVRVATTTVSGVEAWLIYLMPGDSPGVRCIQLPAK